MASARTSGDVLVPNSNRRLQTNPRLRTGAETLASISSNFHNWTERRNNKQYKCTLYLLFFILVKSPLFDNINTVSRGMASSSSQTELKECADAYLNKLVMSPKLVMFLYPNLLSP